MPAEALLIAVFCFPGFHVSASDNISRRPFFFSIVKTGTKESLLAFKLIENREFILSNISEYSKGFFIDLVSSMSSKEFAKTSASDRGLILFPPLAQHLFHVVL